MIQNNTHKNIIAEGFLSSRFDTANFNTTIHKANFFTGVSYFYVAFNPLSTLSDYIGFKSTMGGLTKIKSMIQIPLLFSYPVHAMLKTATCDLTQLWSNAAKHEQKCNMYV